MEVVEADKNSGIEMLRLLVSLMIREARVHDDIQHNSNRKLCSLQGWHSRYMLDFIHEDPIDPSFLEKYELVPSTTIGFEQGLMKFRWLHEMGFSFRVVIVL